MALKAFDAERAISVFQQNRGLLETWFLFDKQESNLCCFPICFSMLQNLKDRFGLKCLWIGRWPVLLR